MEGLKSATNTTAESSSPSGSNPKSNNDSKQQFASYHPNPNFGKFTGKNRNQQNKQNNRNNNNNGGFKPFDNSNNQQQQKKNKIDFINGSNSQNVNPNPSGNGPNNNAHPKKFRPNKRRNNNNNTAAAAAAAASNSNNAQQNTDEVSEVNEITESRLNRSLNKERTPENSFIDENNGKKPMPASISLDNFHIISENSPNSQQRWSPRGNKNQRSPRSPRGSGAAKSDKFNSSMTSSTSHHGFGSASNTIIEHESHEIEIPTTTDHYEVASNDPLAEIFKHATTYAQHEMSLGSLDNVVSSVVGGSNVAGSESSFYSTPLNHTLPLKYDSLLNSTAAAMGSSGGGGSGIASTDASAYFSANERTLSEITMPKISQDIMISSSSSSLSSPEHGAAPKLAVAEQSLSPSNANDSQALVTASEGETSFGLEPNIENTITNVAIETSFANDLLKSSSGENDQKETAEAEKSSHSYMDDLKELSTSMQSAQTAKETEDEETATTTTANSTATTTTAASTMSFINRHLSTVSTPSSSSAGGEEESSTSSPSPSSSSTSKGANTSSSSFSVGSDDALAKKDEEEAVESSSNVKSECEMKTQDEDEITSKTTSDANNYSMQINYPSSTVSEELSSNDRTSSSTSHSSSFNKCESDENEIRCDLSDIPTKFDGEIRIEVAHLIEKIVMDAITQANKKNTTATNDSLIEIDINDTLTVDERRQQQHQTGSQHPSEEQSEKRQSQLIIKPILEQDLVSIDQQQHSVSYQPPQQTHIDMIESEYSSPLKETANASVVVATPKLDTTNDHINESTTSSVNMTKLANHKKNPIIDCFSCSIL